MQSVMFLLLFRKRKRVEKSFHDNVHVDSFPVGPDKHVFKLSYALFSAHENQSLSLSFNFSVSIIQMSELVVDSWFRSLYDELSTHALKPLNSQSWSEAKLLDTGYQRYILTSRHLKSLKESRLRNVAIKNRSYP